MPIPFTPLPGYEQLEATTQIVVAELQRRGIDFELLDPGRNLLLVRHEGREIPILEGTISTANSIAAYWISNDKWLTKTFLRRQGISHAQGLLLREGHAPEELDAVRYPCVVKPLDADHGWGVAANLKDRQQVEAALPLAFRYSRTAIVEDFFPGREYRFLVVGGSTRGVIYREPANVVGDGQSSIDQLVEAKNHGRGTDYTRPLLVIPRDAETQRHLREQGLDWKSVLPDGQKLYLRTNSNLSTGGDSIDMTDLMPEYYLRQAERAAQAAGLLVAGIDIIIRDLEQEPSPQNYIVVELNAPPMLSMHDFPYQGKNRGVARHVVDQILAHAGMAPALTHPQP